MAGIWDKWKDSTGEMIYSFSIITTGPNPLMEKIHDRMPVILAKNDEIKWISETPVAELVGLLHPFTSEQMKAFPVSKNVNSPANDTPDLILPVELI